MKASIVVISLTFLFIAVLAVGWMWMQSEYDDMMFVPRQHDTDRLHKDLESLFGDPIKSATVVRVDRDTNLLFFTVNASQSEIESTRDAFEEQGWSVDSSKSNSKLTLSATLDLGERRVRLLRLESLDDDTYYGGYQFAGNDLNFSARYEENKVYAQ